MAARKAKRRHSARSRRSRAFQNGQASPVAMRLHGSIGPVLAVLHEDPRVVAVRKPSGMLVHRSHLAGDRDTCLTRLRAQLGRWVYPVHRLDRATSGVLLFALDPEA